MKKSPSFSLLNLLFWETRVLDHTEPTQFFKGRVEEREPREGNRFTAFVDYEVTLTPL